MSLDRTQDPEGPSKSELKREAKAITDLGRELIEMNASDLARIPLDAGLRAAIDEARAIRSHGARKRQTLYVGRLMRERDLEPIRDAIARHKARGRDEAARFKRIEVLRDRLLAEGDSVVSELTGSHPDLDRQHLRRLVRDARREADAGKPAGAGRALFRYLRELRGED